MDTAPVTVTTIPATGGYATLWKWSVHSVGSSLGGLFGYLYQTTAYLAIRPNTVDRHRSQVQEALDKLRKVLHLLNTHTTCVLSKIDVYAISAKGAYQRKHLPVATYNMRLMKLHEGELDKLSTMRFNVESSIMRLESVGVMYETVNVIRDTNLQFQQLQRNVNIDHLDNMVDDLHEQREHAIDVESILHDMGKQHDDEHDDDQLLAELEQLMGEPGTDVKKGDCEVSSNIGYIINSPATVPDIANSPSAVVVSPNGEARQQPPTSPEPRTMTPTDKPKRQSMPMM